MERFDGQFVQEEVIVIVLKFTVGIQENPLLYWIPKYFPGNLQQDMTFSRELVTYQINLSN